MFTASFDSGNWTAVTLSPALCASVRKTNPASASPLVTFPSTPDDTDSSLTGLRCTPVLSSMRCAGDPQAADAWHTATRRSGLARSANDRVCFGSPGAVTITSVFDAKLIGSLLVRSALTTVSIWALSAEANTSALAPWLSLFASSDEVAKLKSIAAPGLSVWNFPASRVNAGLSKVAANTTIEWVDDVDAVVDDGVLCPQPLRSATSASDSKPAVHARAVLSRTVTVPSVVQIVIAPCLIRSFHI